VDGSVLSQPLEVAMDPRVAVGAGPLAELLAFQKDVEAVLARSAERHAARETAEAWLRAASQDPRAKPESAAIARASAGAQRLDTPPNERPEAVNTVLSALATDLESADAPPTAAQRELLAATLAALAGYEARWDAFAPTLGELEARLARRGVRPASSPAR
jgi:hypothetical protein